MYGPRTDIGDVGTAGRRGAGLAWWMIAIGGPGRTRGGETGEPIRHEDIPWILILRAAKSMRLTGFLACTMFGLASFTFLVSMAPGAFGPLAALCMLLPLVIMGFGLSACGAVTGFPRWLRRRHMSEDIMLAPISGGAWAIAHARLFGVVAAWCVICWVLPFANALILAWGYPGRHNVAFLLLAMSAAFLSLNWVLYVARIVGGWAVWITTAVLWLAYPVALDLLSPLGLPSMGPPMLWHALMIDPMTHVAFTLTAFAVGCAGLVRSARHYPEILRRKLFP